MISTSSITHATPASYAALLDSRKKKPKLQHSIFISILRFYLEELDTSPANKILGLFSNSELPSNDRSPSLKQMTEKAINVLNTNSERFLLMIEGSQIDWTGHENNFEYMHRELLDVDEAVTSVLDFACH